LVKVLIVYGDTRIYKNKSGDYQLDKHILSAVYAVESALEKKNYKVEKVPIKKNLTKFITVVNDYKPDIIFNLCESVNTLTQLEKNAIALYEIIDIPFTGSGMLTLGICLNKGFAKRLFKTHKIPTPDYMILNDLEFDELPPNLKYPLIIKPGMEDGSTGITSKSVVKNMKSLKSRAKYIFRNFKQFAIVENYISGKELQISVIGNDNPLILAIAELDYKGLSKKIPKICTYSAKWQPDTNYFKFTNPRIPARINETIYAKLEKFALNIYKNFNCRGYARIDLRLRKNKPYFLEVNPNPDISPDAGFAKAAYYKGISYEDLIDQIVKFGLEKPRFFKFY